MEPEQILPRMNMTASAASPMRLPETPRQSREEGTAREPRGLDPERETGNSWQLNPAMNVTQSLRQSAQSIKPEERSYHVSMPQQPTQHASMPQQPTQHASMPEHTTQHASMPEQPTQHASMPQQPTKHASIPEQPTQHASTPEQTSCDAARPQHPTQYMPTPAQPTYHTSVPVLPSEHTSKTLPMPAQPNDNLQQPIPLPAYSMPHPAQVTEEPRHPTMKAEQLITSKLAHNLPQSTEMLEHLKGNLVQPTIKLTQPAERADDTTVNPALPVMTPKSMQKLPKPVQIPPQPVQRLPVCNLQQPVKNPPQLVHTTHQTVQNQPQPILKQHPVHKPQQAVQKSTSQHVHKLAQSVQKILEPVQKPPHAVLNIPYIEHQLQQPVQKPSQPVQKPQQPAQTPPHAVQKPLQPVQKPSDSVDKPLQPVQKLPQPIQIPLQPVQNLPQAVQKPPVHELPQPIQEPPQPEHTSQGVQKPLQPEQKPPLPANNLLQPVQMMQQNLPHPIQIAPQPVQSPPQAVQKQPVHEPPQPEQKSSQPVQKPSQPAQRPPQPAQTPSQAVQRQLQHVQKPPLPVMKSLQPVKMMPQPVLNLPQSMQVPPQPVENPPHAVQKPLVHEPPQPVHKPSQPVQNPPQAVQKPLVHKPPHPSQQSLQLSQMTSKTAQKPQQSIQMPPPHVQKPPQDAKKTPQPLQTTPQAVQEPPQAVKMLTQPVQKSLQAVEIPPEPIQKQPQPTKNPKHVHNPSQSVQMSSQPVQKLSAQSVEKQPQPIQKLKHQKQKSRKLPKVVHPAQNLTQPTDELARPKQMPKTPLQPTQKPEQYVQPIEGLADTQEKPAHPKYIPAQTSQKPLHHTQKHCHEKQKPLEHNTTQAKPAQEPGKSVEKIVHPAQNPRQSTNEQQKPLQPARAKHATHKLPQPKQKPEQKPLQHIQNPKLVHPTQKKAQPVEKLVMSTHKMEHTEKSLHSNERPEQSKQKAQQPVQRTAQPEGRLTKPTQKTQQPQQDAAHPENKQVQPKQKASTQIKDQPKLTIPPETQHPLNTEKLSLKTVESSEMKAELEKKDMHSEKRPQPLEKRPQALVKRQETSNKRSTWPLPVFPKHGESKEATENTSPSPDRKQNPQGTLDEQSRSTAHSQVPKEMRLQQPKRSPKPSTPKKRKIKQPKDSQKAMRPQDSQKPIHPQDSQPKHKQNPTGQPIEKITELIKLPEPREAQVVLNMKAPESVEKQVLPTIRITKTTEQTMKPPIKVIEPTENTAHPPIVISEPVEQKEQPLEHLKSMKEPELMKEVTLPMNISEPRDKISSPKKKPKHKKTTQHIGKPEHVTHYTESNKEKITCTIQRYGTNETLTKPTKTANEPEEGTPLTVKINKATNPKSAIRQNQPTVKTTITDEGTTELKVGIGTQPTQTNKHTRTATSTKIRCRCRKKRTHLGEKTMPKENTADPKMKTTDPKKSLLQPTNNSDRPEDKRMQAIWRTNENRETTNEAKNQTRQVVITKLSETTERTTQSDPTDTEQPVMKTVQQNEKTKLSPKNITKLVGQKTQFPIVIIRPNEERTLPSTVTPAPNQEKMLPLILPSVPRKEKIHPSITSPVPNQAKVQPPAVTLTPKEAKIKPLTTTHVRDGKKSQIPFIGLTPTIADNSEEKEREILTIPHVPKQEKKHRPITTPIIREEKMQTATATPELNHKTMQAKDNTEPTTMSEQNKNTHTPKKSPTHQEALTKPINEPQMKPSYPIRKTCMTKESINRTKNTQPLKQLKTSRESNEPQIQVLQATKTTTHSEENTKSRPQEKITQPRKAKEEQEEKTIFFEKFDKKSKVIKKPSKPKEIIIVPTEIMTIPKEMSSKSKDKLIQPKERHTKPRERIVRDVEKPKEIVAVSKKEPTESTALKKKLTKLKEQPNEEMLTQKLIRHGERQPEYIDIITMPKEKPAELKHNKPESTMHQRKLIKPNENSRKSREKLIKEDKNIMHTEKPTELSMKPIRPKMKEKNREHSKVCGIKREKTVESGKACTEHTGKGSDKLADTDPTTERTQHKIMINGKKVEAVKEIHPTHTQKTHKCRCKRIEPVMKTENIQKMNERTNCKLCVRMTRKTSEVGDLTKTVVQNPGNSPLRFETELPIHEKKERQRTLSKHRVKKKLLSCTSKLYQEMITRSDISMKIPSERKIFYEETREFPNTSKTERHSNHKIPEATISQKILPKHEVNLKLLSGKVPEGQEKIKPPEKLIKYGERERSTAETSGFPKVKTDKPLLHKKKAQGIRDSTGSLSVTINTHIGLKNPSPSMYSPVTPAESQTLQKHKDSHIPENHNYDSQRRTSMIQATSCASSTENKSLGSLGKGDAPTSVPIIEDCTTGEKSEDSGSQFTEKQMPHVLSQQSCPHQEGSKDFVLEMSWFRMYQYFGKRNRLQEMYNKYEAIQHQLTKKADRLEQTVNMPVNSEDLIYRAKKFITIKETQENGLKTLLHEEEENNQRCEALAKQLQSIKAERKRLLSERELVQREVHLTRQERFNLDARRCYQRFTPTSRQVYKGEYLHRYEHNLCLNLLKADEAIESNLRKINSLQESYDETSVKKKEFSKTIKSISRKVKEIKKKIKKLQCLHNSICTARENTHKIKRLRDQADNLHLRACGFKMLINMLQRVPVQRRYHIPTLVGALTEAEKKMISWEVTEQCQHQGPKKERHDTTGKYQLVASDAWKVSASMPRHKPRKTSTEPWTVEPLDAVPRYVVIRVGRQDIWAVTDNTAHKKSE